MIMRAKNKRSENGSGGGFKSKFKYTPPDPKKVKERAEQKGAGQWDSIFKAGTDTYRPKDGDNCIRILQPTWDGHEHYTYDVWIHSFVGPNNGSYVCLSKMLNKPCAICTASKAAKAAGEEDEAKQLQPSRRPVAWILDRDDRKNKDLPLAYAMPWTMDRDIAALVHSERTGKTLLIDHYNVGHDVEFKKKGKGLNTEYYAYKVQHEQTPISDEDDKVEEILEFIHENPIPTILNFQSNDYLKSVMKGEVDEPDEDAEQSDDTDHEEDEVKADKKARAKVARDQDEDDDDGDAPWEDPKKAKQKAKADDSGDDGDADDQDDDDDDDKPVKAKSKSRRKDEDDDEADKRPSRTKHDEDDDDDQASDDDDDDDDDKGDGEEASDDDDDADQGSDDDDDDEDDKPRKQQRVKMGREKDDRGGKGRHR